MNSKYKRIIIVAIFAILAYLLINSGVNYEMIDFLCFTLVLPLDEKLEENLTSFH